MQSIGAAIDIAIAPIFMLVATGTFLNVLTSRLGRILDRGRALTSLDNGPPDAAEVESLRHRLHCGNRAVLLCAVSAVFTCALVLLLFVAETANAPLNIPIGAVFLGSVTTLATGLGFFFAEVAIAVRGLKL